MLCLRINNWLIIWLGLEISLISFLPIITGKKVYSAESSIKFFLIQSIRSLILVLRIIIIIIKIDYEFIIIFAILIKIGVAPLHNWVLSITEGISLNQNLIILTINKIPPLIIISYIKSRILLLSILTILIGSISGLNQASTRKLIIYSSIFNIGLVICLINFRTIWTTYIVIYRMIIMFIFKILSKTNSNYINQIIINDNFKIINWTLLVQLISLGGLPPLLGFSIKLLSVEFILRNSIIINLITIILCSLMIIFFYIRLRFISILIQNFKQKTMFNVIESLSSIIIIINFTSTIWIFMLKRFN